MNNSHPALHGGPVGPDPSGMFPVPGKYKAFMLCFIFYAKDFARSKSEHIDPKDILTAVTDILKHQHNLDIRSDHILAYYREAINNANPSSWNYVKVATYMTEQVQDEEILKQITSFELRHEIAAKLSPVGNTVLEHVRRFANITNPPNPVRAHWNYLKTHPVRPFVKFVDPVLLGKFVETPTFPSDISSQLAAAAGRSLEKSSSNSPEGDAS